MNLPLLIGLAAGCIILMLLERKGVRTTLALTFKGDIKRETAFIAQWGQSAATPLAALLVWQFERPDWKRAVVLLAGVSATSLSCMILKRLCGRVRPNREEAGKFLGPSFKHANFRESFPSSHSACAVALSVILAFYYPQAAATWWGLAIATSVLRYVLDAHWPSDVLAGFAIGYLIAFATLRVAGMT